MSRRHWRVVAYHYKLRLSIVLSSDSVSLCPLTRTNKQTQKGSNQESLQSGNSDDQASGLHAKFLWAPGSKAKRGSGLQSVK